ncbi:hypothetical protein K461DRAFT_93226 [Myriangium duriaei CBS 260.36]|uniref:Uncharacterized protein n=1 Tax=Myriangium duriaei CBS 260.36 TaxID=1168546 RepID=A0A9P4J705_9PEZI|nr:hypothetical protein K461DRAFT_93226 [Myriangium duriaei CBS 260.36]
MGDIDIFAKQSTLSHSFGIPGAQCRGPPNCPSPPVTALVIQSPIIYRANASESRICKVSESPCARTNLTTHPSTQLELQQRIAPQRTVHGRRPCARLARHSPNDLTTLQTSSRLRRSRSRSGSGSRRLGSTSTTSAARHAGGLSSAVGRSARGRGRGGVVGLGGRGKGGSVGAWLD